MKKTTLQAKGEFPFTFFIEKAVPIEEDGKLIVEGVASTINVDHDNERMAESALQSMSTIINDKGVPLRLEHAKDDSAIIGNVYQAWVDDRNQLWIRAAIDPSHPSGPMIHDSLKQGVKFGLSVGGKVRDAVREMVESTGKYIKTFYDVILDEVSVTRKPANYDAWLFAKSIKGEDEDVSPYYNSPLHNQFLFENPRLDYMYQFAKSIPDGEWKKVENNNNNLNKNMNPKDKEMDKKIKKEDGDKDMDKSVTKGEMTSFSSAVFKAIDGLTKAVSNISKAMGDDNAKDTTNPDKNKDQVDTQQTAKSEDDKEDDKKEKSEGDEKDEDKKEKSEGNGGESSKETDNGPKKQANPDMDKEVPDTQQTAKSEDDKEDDKKEKSEGDEKDEDKKEKSADDEDEKKDKASEGDKKDAEEADDYKIKSMGDATERINALTKGLKGEKVTKSQKNETVEVSSIDKFVAAITGYVEALDTKFEKSGTRVPGLRQSIVDMIKNDKELQKEITTMLGETSVKKSVSMGVPYMIDKSGKRFALTATPVESTEIKKSREGRSFKDVFKSEFSSVAPESAE